MPAMGEQRVVASLAPAWLKAPRGLALQLDLPGLAAGVLALPVRASVGEPDLALSEPAIDWGECFVGCAGRLHVLKGHIFFN